MSKPPPDAKLIKRQTAPPGTKRITRIMGTTERRLEFDGAVKEIMRQRKVMSTMQNVAREQRKEMKRMEKMEKKMAKKELDDAEAEKNALKRQALRATQLEHLRTMQELRDELKPQDPRAKARRATMDDLSRSGNEGGMLKNLASNFLAVKKMDDAMNPKNPPDRASSLDMGEFSKRNRGTDDVEESNRSGESERGEPEEPKMFTATLTAMKLAASATHYQANGQSRFNAAVAALKLKEQSAGGDWHTKELDESVNSNLDASLDEYSSRPLPMPVKVQGESGLELINVDDVSHGDSAVKLQDLVPSLRGSPGESRSNSLWMEETDNRMNYDGNKDLDFSYRSASSSDHYESCNDEPSEEEEGPQTMAFRPNPSHLNPLKEDAEASVDSLVVPLADHSTSRGGRHLLKNQGKEASGYTNRTKSTNTLFSSNDSDAASDVSSLRGKDDNKMSRLKMAISGVRRMSSNGSVTSGVSNLSHNSQTQSVASARSVSSWRKRFSGIANGGFSNNSRSNNSNAPIEYVEAQGGKKYDRRNDMHRVDKTSSSMVSDISALSSGRSMAMTHSHHSKRSLTSEISVQSKYSTGSKFSNGSKFNEFFNDRAHVKAISSALSYKSSRTHNKSKYYYRFPTHEHPLVEIRPIEIFPDAPGWQCDSCAMETENMRIVAYVSTDKNFIVCSSCFASLGSRIAGEDIDSA